MARIHTILRKNLESITNQIERACNASSRSPDDVQLIAVTKYAEWEWVQALAELHSAFGESRPQLLAERQPKLPEIYWHQIGRLQRNKARLAVRHANVIHSVDSLQLLQRLSRLAQEGGRSVELLLQVNITGETSKSGFEPKMVLDSWATITQCVGPHAKLTGLMTIAPLTHSSESARPVFAQLAKLQQQLNNQGRSPPLTELSMGMSGDFDVAIEEGATMIRVGRSLFEGLRADHST